MMIEISKPQSIKIILDYIEYELSTKETHSLLKKLLANYSLYSEADMDSLIKPFIKKKEQLQRAPEG